MGTVSYSDALRTLVPCILFNRDGQSMRVVIFVLVRPATRAAKQFRVYAKACILALERLLCRNFPKDEIILCTGVPRRSTGTGEFYRSMDFLQGLLRGVTARTLVAQSNCVADHPFVLGLAAVVKEAPAMTNVASDAHNGRSNTTPRFPDNYCVLVTRGKKNTRGIYLATVSSSFLVSTNRLKHNAIYDKDDKSRQCGPASAKKLPSITSWRLSAFLFMIKERAGSAFLRGRTKSNTSPQSMTSWCCPRRPQHAPSHQIFRPNSRRRSIPKLILSRNIRPPAFTACPLPSGSDGHDGSDKIMSPLFLSLKSSHKEKAESRKKKMPRSRPRTKTVSYKAQVKDTEEEQEEEEGDCNVSDDGKEPELPYLNKVGDKQDKPCEDKSQVLGPGHCIKLWQVQHQIVHSHGQSALFWKIKQVGGGGQGEQQGQRAVTTGGHEPDGLCEVSRHWRQKSGGPLHKSHE